MVTASLLSRALTASTTHDSPLSIIPPSLRFVCVIVTLAQIQALAASILTSYFAQNANAVKDAILSDKRNFIMLMTPQSL